MATDSSATAGNPGAASTIALLPDETPAAFVPVDSTEVLGDLFGTATFLFSFSELGNRLFLLSADYGPEDITIGESGVSVLSASAISGARLEGESGFSDGEELDLGCTYISEQALFACSAGSGDDSQFVFAFDRPIDGTVDGGFEFCEELEVGDCAAEAILAPDGAVKVVIESADAQAAPAAPKTTDTPDTPAVPALPGLAEAETQPEPEFASNNLDILPYLQYAEQGSRNIAVQPPVGEPTGQRAMIGALSEGLEAVQEP